jgi:hypothetical protein
MVERTFDEADLRAAIVERWGAHGAHCDVFDHMRTLALMTQHLLSTLEYLAVVAETFPHINVGPDGELGAADDVEGAWCLGCTVMSETQDWDVEVPRDADGELDLDRARAIVDAWHARAL